MDVFLCLFAKGQLCLRLWGCIDQSYFIPRKELGFLGRVHGRKWRGGVDSGPRDAPAMGGRRQVLRAISCSSPIGPPIQSGYRPEDARAVQSTEIQSLAALSAAQFPLTGAPTRVRRMAGEGARPTESYNWLILAKNSLFDPALASRSISSSIASTGDSGFSTLRRTQMRCKSSFGISNSSLRVPDR
jgi:hypothetical protein